MDRVSLEKYIECPLCDRLHVIKDRLKEYREKIKSPILLPCCDCLRILQWGYFKCTAKYNSDFFNCLICSYDGSCAYLTIIRNWKEKGIFNNIMTHLKKTDSDFASNFEVIEE